MRDYSKVTSAFWTGQTGRQLRGDPEAQVIAHYLLTSPHANMIGAYYCPVAYIAHDTGVPFEGASKALQRVCARGFCTFDQASDFIWVHQMARFQIGDALNPKDNQVKSVSEQFRRLPKGLIKRRFFEFYGPAFHIEPPEDLDDLGSSFEGPSEPLRSQEQEQEQEQTLGASQGEGSQALKVISGGAA